VTVNNISNKAALTVLGVTITRTEASEFSQANSYAGAGIPPGANCTIKVVFAPTTADNATESLEVSDNALGNPQTLPLSGTGTAAVLPSGRPRIF
jgi:hypothetical protein